MHKPEIGEKIKNGLQKVLPRRETEEQKAPDPPDEAGENALYARLKGLPTTLGRNGRALAVCKAQVEDAGEDTFMVARAQKRVFLGVFDGCGGSGAKVYPVFGGHTGAWAASRAAALAAREWFEGPSPGEDLSARIDRALQACRAQQPSGQLLMGSLSREFPTTVAAFTKAVDGDDVDFYWCGDSRCYALDGEGLHQITADDAAIQDAMHSLREDAPMTNVASASRPFVLHHASLKIDRPALILAATDGCFGYLPSPMHFERLVLESVCRARSVEGMKRRLDERIGAVSGDDYTLVGWVHRFTSFRQMHRAFVRRLAFLDAHYPGGEADEAALFARWEQYKPGYEGMLAGLNADSERG